MNVPEAIKTKLHPSRFPNITPKLVALLGWLLKKEFTDPAISALYVTSDGFFLAQNKGDIGFNNFMGDVKDLERNMKGICQVAGLTEDETEWVTARLDSIPGQDLCKSYRQRLHT